MASDSDIGKPGECDALETKWNKCSKKEGSNQLCQKPWCPDMCCLGKNGEVKYLNGSGSRENEVERLEAAGLLGL